MLIFVSRTGKRAGVWRLQTGCRQYPIIGNASIIPARSRSPSSEPTSLMGCCREESRSAGGEVGSEERGHCGTAAGARATKKSQMGTLESTLGPHDIRDQILDYIHRWTEKTEISVQQLLGWAGIPVPTSSPAVLEQFTTFCVKLMCCVHVARSHAGAKVLFSHARRMSTDTSPHCRAKPGNVADFGSHSCFHSLKVR